MPAHSCSVGPSLTGPSMATVSSVNMVMSSAWEFIHSSGDCAARQMRPAPG